MSDPEPASAHVRSRPFEQRDQPTEAPSNVTQIGKSGKSTAGESGGKTRVSGPTPSQQEAPWVCAGGGKTRLRGVNSKRSGSRWIPGHSGVSGFGPGKIDLRLPFEHGLFGAGVRGCRWIALVGSPGCWADPGSGVSGGVLPGQSGHSVSPRFGRQRCTWRCLGRASSGARHWSEGWDQGARAAAAHGGAGGALVPRYSRTRGRRRMVPPGSFT